MTHLVLLPPSGRDFPTLFKQTIIMIGLSASFSEAPSPNKITAHPIMEILEANLFVNVDSCWNSDDSEGGENEMV
jgi:hypothetical protein